MSDDKRDSIEKFTEAFYEKPQRTETWSGIPLKEIYTPEDVKDIDYQRDVQDAGEYPFTRGIYRNMFRGRYWTRRQVAGFGSGADINKRYKYYIEQGFTGLDAIPDLPGLLEIDADHPRAEGEVGIVGWSQTSLQDFEEIFEGIPLDKVTVVWRQPLLVIPCLVILAERQGIDPATLRGSVLNVHPVYYPSLQVCADGYASMDLAMKLTIDCTEYCTRHMPNFYTTYFDGYNLREYGLSAPQELGWMFSQAIEMINHILARGVGIDEFGPRTTFFMTSHIDFLEEIAKFRAARKMWAKIMKERYGARDPRSLKLRFAVQTAGSTVLAQQPLNNIVRIAYEGMAAALGGVQSMSLVSYLEGVSLPTEESATLAVRTQQILAYETGITNVSDPLGGSYYIEYLTNKLEEEANKIIKEVEDIGGLMKAARVGWIDQMVDRAIFQRQKEIESKERIMVGLNAFAKEEKETPGGYFKNPAHDFEKAGGAAIIDRVKKLKKTRNNQKVKEALANLRTLAREGESVNLYPAVIEAYKVYATIGEVKGTIREAYGYSYDPFMDIESPFKD